MLRFFNVNSFQGLIYQPLWYPWWPRNSIVFFSIDGQKWNTVGFQFSRTTVSIQLHRGSDLLKKNTNSINWTYCIHGLASARSFARALLRSWGQFYKRKRNGARYFAGHNILLSIISNMSNLYFFKIFI